MHRHFAETDTNFRKACEQANLALGATLNKDGKLGKPTLPGFQQVLPTKRQASKYLRGLGTAYRFGRETKKD